jgi:hypothetical protein
MVDLSGRIQEIKKLVDAGRYFTINRARQYRKTTTLKALQGGLQDTYEIVSISFEALTSANFATEQSFVKAFCRLFRKNPKLYNRIPEEIRLALDDYQKRKEDKAEMGSDYGNCSPPSYSGGRQSGQRACGNDANTPFAIRLSMVWATCVWK